MAGILPPDIQNNVISFQNHIQKYALKSYNYLYITLVPNYQIFH